tara:strand:+ start:1046 stop:1888 length:843 start_codon:yes stop_codon:yes gene_type:complete
MKLILESWRKYVNEQNDILDDSASLIIKAIRASSETGPSDDDDWGPYKFHEVAERLFDPSLSTEENTKELIQKLPPLAKNNITRVLGHGEQGLVFLLDNGHALKVYKGRGRIADDGSGEAKYYASEKAKLFDQTGSITTLPIYDQGEVTIGKSKIRYVEMARFLPLRTFLENTGRDPASNWGGTNVGRLLISLEKYAAMKLNPDSHAARNRDPHQVVSQIKHDSQEAKITAVELEGLRDLVLNVYKQYGEEHLGDLHVDNVGVLEQSVATGKPVFVLFDP